MCLCLTLVLKFATGRWWEVQADKRVAGPLWGRSPAEAPDGGHPPTSASLSVEAAAAPDMLDSSQGCLSLGLEILWLRVRKC